MQPGRRVIDARIGTSAAARPGKSAARLSRSLPSLLHTSFACYVAATDRTLSLTANTRIPIMMSPPTSDSRSKTVDKKDLPLTRGVRKAPAERPHVAAAAAIDELLASEARASLRRTRDALREEPSKARIRVTVPPARIVAKPLQTAAWKGPFFSLAVVVGLSTLISAGGIAYLFLQPQAIRTTSETELRNLRESVSQLRRQVAELSSSTASIRSANSAQPTVERVASRNAEREPSIQRTRATRPSDDQHAGTAVAQAPEFTGSVQTPAAPVASAPRPIIEGWHIRRIYDGAAVLEGKSGVIEVAPGQDIPTLGRVQEISNDGGRWQVITSKGIVVGR